MVLLDGTRVAGEITATRATVQSVNSMVAGDVQSNEPVNFQTGPDLFLSKVFLCGSSIGGDLVVQNSPSFGSINIGGPRCPNSLGNTIGGDVIDVNNRTGANEPSHAVFNNRINGVLQCSGNVPPPVGSGNQATLKTGQCAAL
ncbi:MAG: hypothetical protein ACLGI2_08870 [Acidimicrobiia bacterium]